LAKCVREEEEGWTSSLPKNGAFILPGSSKEKEKSPSYSFRGKMERTMPEKKGKKAPHDTGNFIPNRYKGERRKRAYSLPRGRKKKKREKGAKRSNRREKPRKGTAFLCQPVKLHRNAGTENAFQDMGKKGKVKKWKGPSDARH